MCEGKRRTRRDWEQREGEPDERYDQFRIYLHAMKPPRRLEEAAKLYGWTYRTIRTVAGKYDWRERAAAWDADQAERRRARWEEAEWHAAHSALLQLAAKYIDPPKRHADPSLDDLERYAALLEKLVRMERRAVGLPPFIRGDTAALAP
jgi:hypothetical protein